MSLEELISSLKNKRLEKTRLKEHVSHEKTDNWRVRAGIYKALLDRYEEVIQLHEEKTIPELKALVDPNDAAVLALKQDLLTSLGLQELSEYDFEPFVDKASAFLRSLAHADSELPFTFWLKPANVLSLKAGDAMDKAILACSLFLSVGIASRIRVLELSSGLKLPVVLCSFSNRVVLVDCAGFRKPSFGLNDDSVVSSYDFEGAKARKSVYEFNNEEYSDFE